MALNDKQRRFVDEYLIDLNATQAATRAGYSAKTAGSQGFDLLKKPEIQEAISIRQKEMAAATGITPEKVLKLWWDQANVDVNEIAEYRREPCDKCWDGQEKQDSPDPTCTSCKGEGFGRLHIADSRKLRGAARRLYNGVQIGKEGIKVLMLDRDKALENVARHLGMFVERKEISGPGGAPVQTQAVTKEELEAAVRRVRDQF